MVAIRYNLTNIELLKGRKIFVDANVLIYLFWSTGRHDHEKNYAKAFKKLRDQKNKMYVDFNVISEVVNRVARLEYNKLVQDKRRFKKFRDSKVGKAVFADIYLIVKERILKNFQITGKIFSKKDIESFLIVDRLDFLDKAIVSVCEENSYVLLTNDKDFQKTNIELFTN